MLRQFQPTIKAKGNNEEKALTMKTQTSIHPVFLGCMCCAKMAEPIQMPFGG